MDRIFSAEIFHGEVGATLRRAGYASDDPGNMVGRRGSTKAQLEEDYVKLHQMVASANRTGAAPIAPFHLLPPQLWETRYGPFLIEGLDMSPYRPWNTVFFPVSRKGGLLYDLPLRDGLRETPMSPEIEALVAMIVDIHRGIDDGPARAFSLMLSHVRQNFPDLFPPEQRDLSPPIARARADLRALAIVKAGIDLATIRKCHAAFLANPESQLLS
jgi:hypothetical protein